MKPGTKLLFVALATILSAHVMGFSLQNDMTARGLYISKRADAMQVRVLDSKTNMPVSPTQEFRKDAKLKVIIESNFEGYVYVINVEKAGSGDKRFLVYPNLDTSNNEIKPNLPLTLPASFDEKPAIEILQVIVSHDRIDYLDSVLKGSTCSRNENRCELVDQIAARTASLVGNKKSDEQGGIISRHDGAQQQTEGTRSRDIKFSAGKDKDAKSTYMAIPVESSGGGRLKSGEVIALEIRLKHI